MPTVAEYAAMIRMSSERLLGYCWGVGIYEKDAGSDLSAFDLGRLHAYIELHPNFAPPTPLPKSGYDGRYFLFQGEGERRSIFVRARLESADGEIVGHLRQQLDDGQGFDGYSFDELWNLGNGGYVLNRDFR
ncbi:MAG TPA: hypothetical protein VJ739_20040 [Gemmataceae bacterium]|nr:hypothetical protein [Gemmataceae bacterium]